MNTRIITVSGISPYSDSKGRFVQIPLVRLQGKWIEKLGFHTGSKIKVYENNGEIILTLVKEV